MLRRADFGARWRYGHKQWQYRHMPRPAADSAVSATPTARERDCVNVGILWGRSSLASTATAVVDVLRAMNMLAAMRPGGAPELRWHWLMVPDDACAECAAASDCPKGGTCAEARNVPPVPGTAVPPQAPDVLVIPGWLVSTGPQLRALSTHYRQHFGAMLRAHAARGGQVAALFNGTSLLACCGLLAGRKAALPWAFAPSITLDAQQSGQDAGAGGGPPAPVAWQRHRPWQRDGALWTTASMQETFSAMLDLLASTCAAELAQAASHVLQFDPQRQLTATAALETPTGTPMGAGTLEQARRWLQAHRNEPYSLQDTARAAATSPRTLLRWFAQVYGQTPQDYLHSLRIAQAQALLQTTYLTVEDVAQQCGYNDTGSFRKVFARLCGVTPGVYRQRFKLRPALRQWSGRNGPPA